jgi:putative FmdB family regulatory protein
MPTYQYACTSCGAELEVVQKFTDDPLTECPTCAGRLRKVFSAVGVVFKGSGFYKTDSRTTAAKPGAGSAGGVSADKPDAKPDGAAEPAKSDKPAEPAAKPATSSSTDTAA